MRNKDNNLSHVPYANALYTSVETMQVKLTSSLNTIQSYDNQSRSFKGKKFSDKSQSLRRLQYDTIY